MTSPIADFDIIIVGSRPAGASLAIRLGRLGFSVLLVDKDHFPSNPSISCPVIFANVMELLDELGIDESEYAYNTPKISSFAVGVKEYFNVTYDLPKYAQRDYVYAIDRKRFDYALVKKAQAQENVTVLNGFKVNNLIYQNEAVTGIIGKNEEGEVQQYQAKCTIGADGRFSTIAKLVQSPIIKSWKKPSSAALYAYWKNVRPFAKNKPTVQFYVPQSGLLFMLLDSADNTTGVIVHGDQRKVYAQTTVQASYESLLNKERRIHDRLKDGQQLDKIRGVRNFKNEYRKAGGPGWFLTGDALHQRDTLDAQGIYEALLFSKLLTHTIELVLHNDTPWDEATQWYEQSAFAMTEPMCKATLKRLLWQHRIPWPGWFIKTCIQWLFRNPEYKERFIRLHLRDIDPQKWIDTHLIIRAVWQGFKQDVFKRKVYYK